MEFLDERTDRGESPPPQYQHPYQPEVSYLKTDHFPKHPPKKKVTQSQVCFIQKCPQLLTFQEIKRQYSNL